MDPVEVKMSKSKPEAMLSIHDAPEGVQQKLNKAFCPEKQVDGNPVLEICKYVVFPELHGDVFRIERPAKFGGNLTFQTYRELEKAFAGGLHPLDLKNATGKYVNQILEPVHAYFEQHPENYHQMKELGIIQ